MSCIVSNHHVNAKYRNFTGAQLETSRATIQSSHQSDVAVQTDLTNNQEQGTGQTAAAQSKSNYYRKSVRRASDDHVAAGSLIGQLSPPPLHNPASAKAASSSSRSKVLPESLEAGDGGCHFIRAGNSCCALSVHSCRFHSCSCCCRATNRQILSKRPSDSSRTKRTRSRKRLDENVKESLSSTSWTANRHDSTAAIFLLNEAWQLAGLHTRQRMSILSRHYRILWKRYRRLRRKHGQLRRIFQRTRRRTLYVQLQLQVKRDIYLFTSSLSFRPPPPPKIPRWTMFYALNILSRHLTTGFILLDTKYFFYILKFFFFFPLSLENVNIGQ